jgi:ABC-type cobalt transport system substrate-binding protein
MDITIEIMVVALVSLVVAVAVLGVTSAQVGDFTGFADDRTSAANCQVAQTQYKNNCNAQWSDFNVSSSCQQPERPSCS